MLIAISLTSLPGLSGVSLPGILFLIGLAITELSLEIIVFIRGAMALRGN